RLKSFFVVHEFSDAQVQSSNFAATVVSAFELLRPYFDYMSDVLTTDLNGESIL
ncbi:TIGR02453 family protein, partial [Flavobacteriaceae bacterium]|nr:TIGR02453 family protein [Flavobacteriaceae bacterium]